jgi:alpha-D-xyloside xylohydrolase
LVPRPRHRAALLVLAALLGPSACARNKAELDSKDAKVVLEASPFRLTVQNAAGRVLLSTLTDSGTTAYGGPAAALDHFEEIPQILPGWDGYRAHEGPWRRGKDAKLDQPDGQHASATVTEGELELHLDVALDGTKVTLHLTATRTATEPYEKSGMAFVLGPDTHFFGLGERYASVDHRGLSLYSWPEEGGLGLGENVPRGPMNPSPNGPSMTYFPVSWLLSSDGYGLLIDTPYRTEVHLGSERSDAFRLAVNHSEFGVTIYVHDDPRASLDDYTNEHGRPLVPVPWAFGPRRRVGPGDMVDGVEEWKVLRRRGVPTTVLDDSLHFLPNDSQLGREADITAWNALIHANGFKTVAYNNPYVSATIPAANADYQYGAAHRYFITDTKGDPALTVLISGALENVASIDFTNPDAVTWYKGLLKRTLDVGYDGWMHDFGEYVARDWVLSKGRGDAYHNLYTLLSATAAHELLSAERGNDYLFYCRSGATGTQAVTPEVWGGDPEASFDETQGMPAMLRGGLNLGMSGVAYWGSDISGFKCITDAVRDKEVYLRWAEMGAMSTSMHDENACSNPLGPRTKWTLWGDDQTVQVYGAIARLHTRMNPYYMVLAREAHATGLPVLRHPFLYAPADPKVWPIEDSFFVGAALYAAPVVRRGLTARNVYFPALPSGAVRYVDLTDDKVYASGADAMVPAPLEKLPLFLVEGQLLPLYDPTIETLVTATATSVVSPDKVADRLDVMVALAPGDKATLTLADGTQLAASRATNPQGGVDTPLAAVGASDIDGCASCAYKSHAGDVDRWQLNSAQLPMTVINVSDLALVSTGTVARRIRWDVLRL